MAMMRAVMTAKKSKIVVAVAVLAALHLVILFAGFVAPADPTAQNRDFPYAPPSRLHFIDARGHLHLRPFIYQWTMRPDSFNEYEESREREYPVQVFVAGAGYKIAGL